MKYSEGKEAMRTLEARGWEHVYTLMSGNPTNNGEYGMLFIKILPGKPDPITAKFWLNKDTFKNLPE